MAKLCKVDDIDPAHGRECMVESEDGPRYVVLLRAGENVSAWLNVCPHMGRSLSWAPGEFLFDPQGRLVCPHHGAIFETHSGECVEGPCRGASLTPLAIEVRGGEVFTTGQPDAVR